MKYLALALLLVCTYAQAATNPDPVEVSDLTPTSVRLSWDAVEGVTHYRIWKRCTMNYSLSWCSIMQPDGTYTITETTYVREGLTPDRDYEMLVTSEPTDGSPAPLITFTTPSGNETDGYSQYTNKRDCRDAGGRWNRRKGICKPPR